MALLFSPASALEYHYTADLYPNHFYTSTSSNRALDIDSADDSDGASIIIPSDSMSTDADSTTPRKGSPVIPVGSYIDPWGDAVEQQINTDEKLNGLEGASFNRLEGAAVNSGNYTAQTQLVTTSGHFGAVSIGNCKLFAYVYPGATYESMRKGAGHVDGTSVWNGAKMGLVEKSLAGMGYHQRHRRVYRLYSPAVQWSGNAGLT